MSQEPSSENDELWLNFFIILTRIQKDITSLRVEKGKPKVVASVLLRSHDQVVDRPSSALKGDGEIWQTRAFVAVNRAVPAYIHSSSDLPYEIKG
jgi:hypothetical protein